MILGENYVDVIPEFEVSLEMGVGASIALFMFGALSGKRFGIWRISYMPYLISFVKSSLHL